jgi:hypothetical protein
MCSAALPHPPSVAKNMYAVLCTIQCERVVGVGGGVMGLGLLSFIRNHIQFCNAGLRYFTLCICNKIQNLQNCLPPQDLSWVSISRLCRRHRHSGILHLSPVPIWFRHRHFFFIYGKNGQCNLIKEPSYKLKNQ